MEDALVIPLPATEPADVCDLIRQLRSQENENVFREIQPDSKIVLEHLEKPWYKLTVTLTARGDQTNLGWVQEFESPEFAAKMRSVCEPANEQNLDRLESILADESF